MTRVCGEVMGWRRRGGSLDSGSHPIKLFIEIHILEFIKSIRAETLARIGIIMKDESRSFLSLP